jgi:hypothetical protein
MGKFETLTPQRARTLEEEAVKAAEFSFSNNKLYKDLDIILIIKSIFPFELFPDELIIRKERVTLINRTLPRVTMVRDMHMHDIAQAEADCGPVFGHLHVYPKLRTEEPLLIERVKRKDVLKAREIIESFIVRKEPRSTY